jgi:hypothetical protein
MTVYEFQTAESDRRERCAQSFHCTDWCLSRSRLCLESSYALFARNPRISRTLIAIDWPHSYPKPQNLHLRKVESIRP